MQPFESRMVKLPRFLSGGGRISNTFVFRLVNSFSGSTKRKTKNLMQHSHLKAATRCPLFNCKFRQDFDNQFGISKNDFVEE